jgi:hypothetical protein
MGAFGGRKGRKQDEKENGRRKEKTSVLPVEQKSVTPRRGQVRAKEKRGPGKRDRQQSATRKLCPWLFLRVRSSLRWAEDERRRGDNRTRGRKMKRKTSAGVERGRKANYIKTHGYATRGLVDTQLSYQEGRQ